MKKILAFLLVIVMLLSATACGGAKDKSNDDLLGIYTGTTVDVMGTDTPIEEIYGEDNSIELQKNGKAVFTLGGEPIKCDWELDGEELTITVTGVKSFGTLKNGKIVLDFMEMGMDMTFEKEGAAAEEPAQTGTASEVPDKPEAELAGSMMDAFGIGDVGNVTRSIENPSTWYGWLTMTDFWGDIDQQEDMYDVWGFVDTASDGRTFFEVFQDGNSQTPLMSMYATIEDGNFICPLIGDEDAWFSDTYLDPEADDTMYEGRLVRDGSLRFEFDFYHYSGDYGCHITMFFREDGAEWDEDLDTLPPRYEEYKAALAGSSGSTEVSKPEPSAAPSEAPAAAPSGFGGEHTATIAEFMTDLTADFTFTLPDSGWVLEVYGDSTIYLYNVPTPDDAYSNSPRIQFELKENLEKIDFYKDQFENLKEIEPRTIGGIQLKGRTYKNVGMDWIEYYGELPNGVWVTVKISDVDISAGTEGSAILDSVIIK